MSHDTWLRWAGAELDVVREPRANLVRIAARQAFGRLRASQRASSRARARGHVAARRPRGPVSAAENRVAFVAFQRALVTDGLLNLLDLLVPDVVALRGGGAIDIDVAVALRIGGGRITGLCSVRCPEKLTRMERGTAVGR
ncbi:hypothetical protein [Streptomyces sp. NPDC058157]|uniref:hypothetical protein n=1 Tax=Streptomyces sp. NPDC058157 TaxID=3346360 RepID=UPI0036EEB898